MAANLTLSAIRSMDPLEAQKVLKDIFSGLQDPDDWKAPIDRVVDPSDEEMLDVYCYAVRYFTATEPTLQALCDGRYRIKSEGYRAGPAGP